MIAFIVSPETDSDHSIIWGAHAKLLALRPSEELSYSLPIANRLYEASFRAFSDDEYIGRLRLLKKPLLPSNKKEDVGGVLTSQILSGGPSAQKRNDAAIDSVSSSLRIGKPPSLHANIQREYLPRILVVDDSDVIRKVTDIFLAPDFPRPFHAKDGSEALDILRSEHVDLILMDIHMPDMNGVDVALRIREADAPWSNIVIIALTADITYQHSRVYRNIGMDDAISKPIRQDVLIRTILTNWNAAKLIKEARSARLEHAS